MLKTKDGQDCKITEKIFKVEVLKTNTNINYDLCQGILKRIFSKQICFTYFIEGFDITKKGFVINFRFVCHNTEGQRKRYLSFKNLPVENLEQALIDHKNKTVDNFCGEFFKRLKRQKFDVVIDNKKVDVIENPFPEIVDINYQTSVYRSVSVNDFSERQQSSYQIVVKHGKGSFIF